MPVESTVNTDLSEAFQVNCALGRAVPLLSYAYALSWAEPWTVTCDDVL